MDVSLKSLSHSLRSALEDVETHPLAPAFRRLAVAGERVRRGLQEATAAAKRNPEAASLLARYDRILAERAGEVVFNESEFSSEASVCLKGWSAALSTELRIVAFEEADALLSVGAACWRAGLVTEATLDEVGGRLAEAILAFPRDPEVAEFAADVDSELAPDPDKPFLFRFWVESSELAPSRVIAGAEVARAIRRQKIAEDFLTSVARMESRARAERGWPEWIARLGRHVREVFGDLSLDLPAMPALAASDADEPPTPRPRVVIGEGTEDVVVSLVQPGQGVQLHVESSSRLDHIRVQCDGERIDGRFIGLSAWEGDVRPGCWLVECNDEAIAFRLADGKRP